MDSSIETTTAPTAFGPARLLTTGSVDRPTLVLIHGYAASADQWRPLMERLAGDLRCLAPDLLGFAWAPAPPPPYQLGRWLDQVDQLLATQTTGPVVLVGHSLGGLVAVEAARRWPERCLALALIDPLGILPSLFARATLGPARHLVDPLRHSDLAIKTFRLLRSQQRWLASPLALSAFHNPRLAPPSAVTEWRALISRPGADYALIDIVRHIEGLVTTVQPGEILVPSLIIWGLQDRLIPSQLAQAWRRRLPRAELILLHQCGHLPHVEQVEAVELGLRRLLGQLRHQPAITPESALNTPSIPSTADTSNTPSTPNAPSTPNTLDAGGTQGPTD